GQRRRVRDREGHVEHPSERAREQRLARARRPHEQHVRLLDLHLVDRRVALAQTLVVVVDRDREHLLRLLLADHELVQIAHDLDRRGELRARIGGESRSRAGAAALGRTRGALTTSALFLLQDRVANLDALVADVHAGRTRDERVDVVSHLLAEGAAFDVAAASGRPGHVGGRERVREREPRTRVLFYSLLGGWGLLLAPCVHDVIDETEVLRLLGREEVVAVRGPGDVLRVLARVIGKNFLEPPLGLQDLFDLDLHVARRALHAAPG